MKGCKIVISTIAKEDLAQIYEYGQTQFGNQIATRYLASLKSAFMQLVNHPKMGSSRCSILPGLKALVINHHVIYYFFDETTWEVQIIRILHDRQDVNVAFKDH